MEIRNIEEWMHTGHSNFVLEEDQTERLLWPGNSKPCAKVFLHKRKAIAKRDLWFPTEKLFSLCDIWLPLARIIWNTKRTNKRERIENKD
ncbi:hypothetical protein Leryth_014651 [Lithospermum erythrorhizon]|nr:hypothetical protein Leryth_014651 [Lithospermum erythrorhizon]